MRPSFLPALSVCTVMLSSAACATTTTRIAHVAPDRVRAEEARQREIVLKEVNAEQQRLDSLAYPLLLAASELCGEKAGPISGFRNALWLRAGGQRLVAPGSRAKRPPPMQRCLQRGQ
jgi:hypothetical protein